IRLPWRRASADRARSCRTTRREGRVPAGFACRRPGTDPPSSAQPPADRGRFLVGALSRSWPGPTRPGRKGLSSSPSRALDRQPVTETGHSLQADPDVGAFRKLAAQSLHVLTFGMFIEAVMVTPKL